MSSAKAGDIFVLKYTAPGARALYPIDGDLPLIVTTFCSG